MPFPVKRWRPSASPAFDDSTVAEFNKHGSLLHLLMASYQATRKEAEFKLASWKSLMIKEKVLTPGSIVQLEQAAFLDGVNQEPPVASLPEMPTSAADAQSNQLFIFRSLSDRWKADLINPLIQHGASSSQISASMLFAEPYSLNNSPSAAWDEYVQRVAKALELVRYLSRTGPRPTQPNDHAVYVCAFDMTKGFLSNSGNRISGAETLDGVWHVSLIAFNTEYQMSHSVQRTPLHNTKTPMIEDLLRHRGASFANRDRNKVKVFKYEKHAKPACSKAEFECYLDALSGDRFAYGNYDVLQNNCVDFVQDCLWFLCRDQIVGDYARQVSVIRNNNDLGIGFILNTMHAGFQAELSSSDPAISPEDLAIGINANSFTHAIGTFIQKRPQLLLADSEAAERDAAEILLSLVPNPAVVGGNPVAERNAEANRIRRNAPDVDPMSLDAVPELPRMTVTA